MIIKRKMLIGVLSAALIISSITTAGATSASAASPPAATPATERVMGLKYDSRDVISYFILGTGPLVERHAELSKRLRIRPQDVPADVVDDIVATFEAVDPELQSRVVEPVQSGDPSRAQAALEALTADVSLVAEQLKSDAENPEAAERATARGWTYTVNWVATVQVAAAGAYVVALGAAVVLAVVLYSPADNDREFDRELAAKAVAQEL